MGDDQAAKTPGSGAYWRTKTDGELRHLMDGNIVGSPAYKGAREEMDRRGADRDRKRETLWIKLTFAATVLLGIGGIIATLAS